MAHIAGRIKVARRGSKGAEKQGIPVSVIIISARAERKHDDSTAFLTFVPTSPAPVSTCTISKEISSGVGVAATADIMS